MTHLLDSSAFFAYFFGEPGKEQVEQLFEDDKASIGLSVLTAVELWARLQAEGHEEAFEEEWEAHLPLFENVVAADMKVARKAVELRRKAGKRVPAVDSLIAASASVSGAILVHRDPHFLSIPEAELAQQVLPES